MAVLITITGPIAAGKNTAAAALAGLAADEGLSVVVVDVDDLVAMVASTGADGVDPWPTAHDAHGALVARWLDSAFDLVVAVGPFHTPGERAALLDRVPAGVATVHVLLDAPLTVTWERAAADPSRGLSRQRDFHERAHARFRSLVDDIPADLRLDTSQASAEQVAAQVLRLVRQRVGSDAG